MLSCPLKTAQRTSTDWFTGTRENNLQESIHTVCSHMACAHISSSPCWWRVIAAWITNTRAFIFK